MERASERRMADQLPLRLSSPDIAVDRRGGVLWILLDRPQSANAYTQQMLDALESAVGAADEDAGLRTIVITGRGDRAFCAGADRAELAARDSRQVLSLAAARVFARLQSSRCVTIAGLNGAAVGGGLELALACDLRLTAPHTRFWLPEPLLGLIPAAGATVLLPKLVGPARAKELVLAGAEWDAQEALRYGLVNEVVGEGLLESRLEAWCEGIARRDPLACQLAKRALDFDAAGGREYALVAQALLTRGVPQRSG